MAGLLIVLVVVMLIRDWLLLLTALAVVGTSLLLLDASLPFVRELVGAQHLARARRRIAEVETAATLAMAREARRDPRGGRVPAEVQR